MTQPARTQPKAIVLFNSYSFVLAFMPVALAGFFVLARLGAGAAACWLIAASVVFYGWWNPGFVLLLAVSTAANYTLSRLIEACRDRAALRQWLLGGGIATNLAALVYFKYLYAVVQFLHQARVVTGGIEPIVLPLGISFFTFTQIGYLIDRSQGVASDRGPLSYALFVTFFPHLIAGPILHNREMMPQFADPATYRPQTANISVGLSIFVIGLLKKCLLADPNAAVVAAGFAQPETLTLWPAWAAALSYSLQLYFDFSGYSDMAIGLAQMFNVRFPLNFDSPYKSACIIDYWQRWHMTLTRYLTLYLYNPIALAMARRWQAGGGAATRRAVATPGGFSALVMWPTLVTITLAGIWHGAGLQFIVFGLLHGVYLCINHAWRIFGPRPAKGAPPSASGRSAKGVSDSMTVHAAKVLLTYLCVLVASIFFRASSVAAALGLLGAMLGRHGVAAPPLAGPGVALRQIAWLACLYGLVWFAPNTQQIMRDAEPAIGRVTPPAIGWIRWRPSLAWAMLLGAAAALGMLSIGGTTEFIYFQF